MPLRWLVTGASGMVGRDVVQALAGDGDRTVALSRADLDVTDAAAVASAVRDAAPDVIVNCAAYTKVDDAETDEARATAVNGDAVGFLAAAANETGALLVQISTDFVFDGARRTPYEVDDATAPLSAYGRSKLAGEHAAASAERHVILRTAWLFGIHGPNFVEAMRGQIAKGTNPLRVVNDQRGRPTYTPHLARAIVRVARRAHEDESARGIVHYADAPECTWFDFARAIVAATGAATEVRAVTTAEFPRPAARPAYSVLSTTRYEQITGAAPQSWQEGLHQYLLLRR